MWFWYAARLRHEWWRYFLQEALPHVFCLRDELENKSSWLWKHRCNCLTFYKQVIHAGACSKSPSNSSTGDPFHIKVRQRAAWNDVWFILQFICQKEVDKHCVNMEVSNGSRAWYGISRSGDSGHQLQGNSPGLQMGESHKLWPWEANTELSAAVLRGQCLRRDRAQIVNKWKQRYLWNITDHGYYSSFSASVFKLPFFLIHASRIKSHCDSEAPGI